MERKNPGRKTKAEGSSMANGARAIEAEIRTALQASIDKVGLNTALDALDRWNVTPLAYGVAWALATGRLNAMADRRVSALNGRGVIKLIAAMTAAGVKTIGDVPRWLNENRSA